MVYLRTRLSETTKISLSYPYLEKKNDRLGIEVPTLFQIVPENEHFHSSSNNNRGRFFLYFRTKRVDFSEGGDYRSRRLFKVIQYAII